MQALPLIISAVGTAATISANNRADAERRQIMNAQLERDQKTSEQANQQIQQEGQRFTQAAREQGLTDAENKTYQQTQADLQGAGGASISGAADAGNVSDDFLKTKAARAIEEGTRLTAVAREAAKARAPGMLGENDSLSRANLAGNLQDLWGTTDRMAKASSLDAQSVRPSSLGKVASALGGMAAKSGGINFGS